MIFPELFFIFDQASELGVPEQIVEQTLFKDFFLAFKIVEDTKYLTF